MSLLPYRHVVLIGVSGAGKTTLAPFLADRLKMPWCDTDRLIDERTGTTGGGIIEHEGIDVFRSIEETIVCDILTSSTPHVIATGAGAWTIGQVRKQCARTGVSVWLNHYFDELVKRVANSDRYITRARAPEVVIAEQIYLRTPLYAKADIRIDCHGMTIAQTVETIWSNFVQLSNVEDRLFANDCAVMDEGDAHT